MRHITPYHLFEQAQNSGSVISIIEKDRFAAFGHFDVMEEDHYDSLFDAIDDSLNDDNVNKGVVTRSFYWVEDTSRFRYGLDSIDLRIIDQENDYREIERAEKGHRLIKDGYEDPGEFDPFDEYDEISQVAVSKDPMKTYIGPETPPKVFGGELIFYYHPSEGIPLHKLESLPLTPEQKEILIKRVKANSVRKKLF